MTDTDKSMILKESKEFLDLLAQSLSNENVDFNDKEPLYEAVIESIRSLPNSVRFKEYLLTDTTNVGDHVRNEMHDIYLKKKYKIEALNPSEKTIKITDDKAMWLKTVVNKDYSILIRNVRYKFEKEVNYWLENKKEIETLTDNIKNLVSIIMFNLESCKEQEMCNLQEVYIFLKMFCDFITDNRAPLKLCENLTGVLSVMISRHLDHSSAVDFFLSLSLQSRSKTGMKYLLNLYKVTMQKLVFPEDGVEQAKFFCFLRRGLIFKFIGQEHIVNYRKGNLDPSFERFTSEIPLFRDIETPQQLRDKILNKMDSRELQIFMDILKPNKNTKEDVSDCEENDDANQLFTVDVQGIDELLDNIADEEEKTKESENKVPTKRKGQQNNSAKNSKKPKRS